MASKRVKTFLFQNAKKTRMKKSIFYWVSIKDILASRKARNFCKKGKIIFIKNSLRWAQSGFCSFNRLEVTSKTINLYQEWLVQQSKFQICETKSSFTKWNAIYSAWNMENWNHQLSKDIILPFCTFSIRFWAMPSELIKELPGCRYTFFQDCTTCITPSFPFCKTNLANIHSESNPKH